jgi:hypothetical protein
MSFFNKKTMRKGGTLSKRRIAKARSRQSRYKKATSQRRLNKTLSPIASPSVRLTRRLTHHKSSSKANMFLVFIMSFGGAAANIFNAIDTGKEIHSVVSRRVTTPAQTQILGAQMSSIYPSLRPLTIEQAFDNMEIIAACTGNTCRSTAIKIAGAELGMDINTCGTAARKPGSGPTPALSRALTTTLGMEIGRQHGSVQCDPCGDMFSNAQGKIYGVVAHKNKMDLLKLAAECRVPIPAPNIIVLGDVIGLEPCKPLKIDPYFVSQAAICPTGDCTEAQLETERRAYAQLVVDSRKCVNAIKKMTQKSAKKIRSSASSLSTISEE